MIDVDLPADPTSSLLVRSFAACLASVTETPPEHLPRPAADLDASLGTWRTWLAQHSAGLVPIADPGRFQWAGWWIAIVTAYPSDTVATEPHEIAVLAFGTPPGIVLSPTDATLLGRATAGLDITAAYAVSSLDPTLHPARPVPQHGTVEALAVAPAAEADMHLLDAVHAIEGRGLDGDRYAARPGTFSPTTGRPGYDLTLIAAEALEDLADTGNPVDFAATRRNVLTRGIDLDVLIGRTFTIGDVLCRGSRRCEPCAHLERVSGPGHLRPLIHRGGLRADILEGGTIAPGAPIRAEGDAPTG